MRGAANEDVTGVVKKLYAGGLLDEPDLVAVIPDQLLQLLLVRTGPAAHDVEGRTAPPLAEQIDRGAGEGVIRLRPGNLSATGNAETTGERQPGGSIPSDADPREQDDSRRDRG